MIPPSSLARLVLGYLEEEGLQRTAEIFQEEYTCNSAIKDPLTQCSSLKLILEEYAELKDSVNQPKKDSDNMVIPTLWKKLDVVVGQLKYHTIPETKAPRVKSHRTYRRRSSCGKMQIVKPVSTHQSGTPNSTRHNNPLQNKQGVVSTSDGNNLENQHVLPTTVTNTNTDSPRVVPYTLPMTSINQNFFLDTVSPENNLSTLSTAGQSSSSGQLICTCPESPDMTIETTTPTCISASSLVASSAEVAAERSTSPLSSCTSNGTSNQNTCSMTCSTTSLHGVSAGENDRSGNTGCSSKMEILSKSPKRKGHPPKKRNFCNPSPSKLLPIDSNPTVSQTSENNFDLQQLLDGGNLDIDAAMPLLLDTFLSTPLLQEKLAENINKVVTCSSSKPNEVETEVVSESIQVPSSKGESQLEEPQVPVDDILNLMEADPAFDSLFSLLTTDGVKSPAKTSQAVTTCSYSVEVSSGSATSTACLSTELVPSGNTTNVVHSSTPESSVPAMSAATESLLLLASSPSKCPVPTSTTRSLGSLHVISPKEVTPESVHKQHTDKVSVALGANVMVASGSGDPVHVRSLQFQVKQPIKVIGKPKKPKSVRQKRNTTRPTSSRVGLQRLKKLNNVVENIEADMLLQQRSMTGNVPSASVEEPCSFQMPGDPSTASAVDVSTLSLLQSFASFHSNSNGSNGNGMGMKKPPGNTFVQLLQDAAIHQQVQGTSTNEKQTMYPPEQSSASHHTQGSTSKTLYPAAPNTSLQFNELKSTGVNISQPAMLPRQISSALLTKQYGERQLLPRPSVQTQNCSLPLLSNLVRAPPRSSCVRSLSTPQASSLTSAVSSSLSSAASFIPSSLASSVTSAYALSSMPPYHPLSSTLSSSSSSSLPSSSSSSSSVLISSSLQSSSSSSSSFNQLSSVIASTPPFLPSFVTSCELPSSLPSTSSLTPHTPLQPSSSSSLPSSVLIPSSLQSSSLSQELYVEDLNIPISSSQPAGCPFSSQPHSQIDTVPCIPTNALQTTVIHNSSKNQKLQQRSKDPRNQGVTALTNSSSTVAMVTGHQGNYLMSTSPYSNEASPTSRNAEECVSGFISGFEVFLGNDQTSCSVITGNEHCRILNSASHDKDVEDARLSKQGTDCNVNSNSKELRDNKNDLNGSSVDNDVHKSNIKEVNKRNETEETRKSPEDVVCAEERHHGYKRPACQDLKENKPKKSKGSKKSKKLSKALPKDFDVEKFLSRLHYVEK